MATKTEESAAPARIPNPAVDPVGYLKARGWTQEGDRWIDPPAPVNRKVQIGVEKSDTGKETPILQLVVGPTQWTWTQAEAVEIQQERDRTAKK